MLHSIAGMIRNGFLTASCTNRQWWCDDIYIYAGWWFGTFYIFHILGTILPTDFHIFQRGRYTTNQVYVHAKAMLKPRYGMAKLTCLRTRASKKSLSGVARDNSSVTFLGIIWRVLTWNSTNSGHTPYAEGGPHGSSSWRGQWNKPFWRADGRPLGSQRSTCQTHCHIYPVLHSLIELNSSWPHGLRFQLADTSRARDRGKGTRREGFKPYIPKSVS